jgi:hypothetical protein
MTKQGWHRLGRGTWRHALIDGKGNTIWPRHKECVILPLISIRPALGIKSQRQAFFFVFFIYLLQTYQKRKIQRHKQWGLEATVAGMKVSCDVATRSLVETDRRFKGVCCLYHWSNITLMMVAVNTSETSASFLPEYIWQHYRRLWSRQCLQWEH